MAERGGLRAAPAGATGSGGGQTGSRELRAQGRPWPRGVSPCPTVSLPKATGGDNCPGGCWLGSPPPRHPNPPMHRGWKLSVTLNCFSAAFEKAGDPRAETKGFVCTNTISSGPKQLSGAVWPRPLRSLRRGRDGPGGKGGLRGGGGAAAEAWSGAARQSRFKVGEAPQLGSHRPPPHLPPPFWSSVTNHLRCTNHLFLLVSRGKISLMLLRPPSPLPLPPNLFSSFRVCLLIIIKIVSYTSTSLVRILNCR